MEHGIRAVSIGGGTGQPRAIAALRHMGASIDSVVAMADDGGSTGVLRERAGILPPGDVRKCLSALAGDPECAFARAFAHRFPYIDDHALGNLVLTALAEETDSFSQAIRVCEELLRCVGHVHPSTLDPVTMSGVTVAGQQIHGQARISYGGNAMRRVWLDQQDPAANRGRSRPSSQPTWWSWVRARCLPRSCPICRCRVSPARLRAPMPFACSCALKSILWARPRG